MHERSAWSNCCWELVLSGRKPADQGVQEQKQWDRDGKHSDANSNAHKCMKDDSLNPLLVFTHHKEPNQLQKLLAKHHSPKVTKQVGTNSGTDQKLVVSIVLENNGTNGNIVSLDDWLNANSQTLKQDISCQTTTRETLNTKCSLAPTKVFKSLATMGRSQHRISSLKWPKRPNCNCQFLAMTLQWCFVLIFTWFLES